MTFADQGRRLEQHLVLLAVLVCVPAVGHAQSYESPVHDLSPAVQQHVDLAYYALDGAVSKAHLGAMLFGLPMGGPEAPGPQGSPGVAGAQGKGGPGPNDGVRKHRHVLPATQVFDQLFYLGHEDVTAWALKTSDGIILIDSLDSTDEAQKYIEDGLRGFHLDPAQIKYIVITHGHPDHYGGSKYLQEKYHPRVLMSVRDWKDAAEYAPRITYAGFPAHDMDINDGQTLKLGDTEVTLYLTPGHTAGTVSLIFPVTDHGEPHVVSFFGGYGTQFIDRDTRKGGWATMRASLLRFGKLSLAAKGDIILANHTFNDGSDEKVAELRAGQTGGRNPWIAGVKTVQLFYLATIEAVAAAETYYTEHPGSSQPLQVH